MDASIWIGATFGLIGTIVGGAVSIATTIMANRLQAKAARQQVIDERIDSAAEVATSEFVRLKQHFWVGLGSGREVERNEAWEEALHDRLAALEPVLLRMRHRELRSRLHSVTEFLRHYSEIEDITWDGHPLLPQQLCEHALECLGAFVRDEPVPEPDRSFSQADHVEAVWYNNVIAPVDED
ncbi:hypothetical protein [Streptomyces sp. B8F3]|uniref:hypothetical protein n=1 Tax=unclassified Streptomyces TaxID=2593676 RepID=UPI00325F0694